MRRWKQRVVTVERAPDPGHAWLQQWMDRWPRPMEVLARDGRLVVWNRAAERTYGWTRDEMRGQYPPYRGFVPPAHRQSLSSWLKFVVDTGEPLENLAAHRSHRDGTLIDVSLTMGALPSAGGKIPGAIVADVDISERARFLHVAAHELRNPMTSVKGIMSLVRRHLAAGTPPASVSSWLEVAEGEIDRLSTMLSEVIEAFRNTNSQLEHRSLPVDLAEVVTAALRPFQAASEIHRFVFDTPTGRHVCVSGDARRLEDVVRNLLSNARKYSPHGGEIRVILDTSAMTARVTVQDQGVGIPEVDLPNIFQPFFRARTEAGPDPGGVGLGLNICWDIVSRHHGRIWAENNPAGGAVVHFEIPLLTG